MITLKNNGWHEWKKTGIVSEDEQGMYSKVECDTCGMLGNRYNPYEVEVESIYPKSKRTYCVYRPSKIPRIKLTNPSFKKFGFEIPIIVEVLPCPREFEKQYANDPWVFSTVENTLIRVEEKDYEIA